MMGIRGEKYRKLKGTIPDNVIMDFINSSESGTYKIKELYGIDQKGKYDFSKWKFLAKCPYMISNHCCSVMKKAPSHKYAKETGRKQMTGQMAAESKLREMQWMKFGCNGFDMKSPTSNPMAFWTEQDVLLYIKQNNIPMCSVYGEIVKDTDCDGQMDLEDVYGKDFFDMGTQKLKTTGCERTGCMFCGFGAHLEKSPGRFEMMKKTHPKQYDYIMRPLEEGGLNYKAVIDWINENGGTNIRY